MGSSTPQPQGRRAAPRTARPEGTRRTSIDGSYAIWIEGLHVFFFKPTADHTFHIGRSRLAANALLGQRGNVMIRLEAEFDKLTAIEIARSLR